MVTSFNAFLLFFLMDILKFWIILKCSGKNYVILRVFRWMFLGKYACLDRYFIFGHFFYSFSVRGLLAMWHSCLLHLHYISTFNLTFLSYFLSHFTYSVIFINASQESCYSYAVTEHYFNLPKYYFSKHY